MKPASQPPQPGGCKVCTASPSLVPAELHESCDSDPHLKADRGDLCWRCRDSHICSLSSPPPLFITLPLPNIPTLAFSSLAQIHICSGAQKNTNLYRGSASCLLPLQVLPDPLAFQAPLFRNCTHTPKRSKHDPSTLPGTFGFPVLSEALTL